jgi:hypothetical protein
MTQKSTTFGKDSQARAGSGRHLCLRENVARRQRNDITSRIQFRAERQKLNREKKDAQQDKSCAFRRGRSQHRFPGIGRDQALSRHPC